MKTKTQGERLASELCVHPMCGHAEVRNHEGYIAAQLGVVGVVLVRVREIHVDLCERKKRKSHCIQFFFVGLSLTCADSVSIEKLQRIHEYSKASSDAA